MNKYKIDDIKYFLHGTTIGKCVVDEIINHETRNGVIVKYMIRPYGMTDYIPVDENQLYDEFVDVKKKAQVLINDGYNTTMEKISELTYEQFETELASRKKKIEDEYSMNVENLNSLDEEYFDEKERNMKKEEK